MKKLALFAATIVALNLSPVAARAADKPSAPVASAPMAIGIVDLRKVIEDSTAGKGLNAQMKARQEAIQKEATEYEKKLKAQEQDIVSKRKDMKPEEFEAKKKGFEEELLKSRQAILTKSAALEDSRKSALGELQKAIGKASANVADTKKLQLIVDRQFVILAEEGMDITADVLKNLNASVKSITLPAGKK